MRRLFTLGFALLMLSACSELELGSHIAKQIDLPSDTETKVGSFKVGNPYRIKGRTYYPQEKYQFSETGIASWYGPGFHGKLTANGEIFNKYDLTAAHRTLQMPSIVRVTNMENGRSIILRVNDRGPFAHNRIIDLSEKAAEILGMKKQGTAKVRVSVLEQESRQVASAAKKGLSTRGTEIALNRGQSLGDDMALEIATPVQKPISSPYAQRPNRPQQKMFDDIIIKQAYASENTKKPIRASAQYPQPKNIYVKTGHFDNEDNALTMKMGLYSIDEPIGIHETVTDNQSIYHLKIGPLTSVEKADEIMRKLSNKGRESRVIIAGND